MYRQNRSIGLLLILYAAIIILLTLGIIFIYSASTVYAMEHTGQAHYFAQKHIVGIVVGLIGFCIMYAIPLKLLMDYIPLAFLCSITLTLLTLLPFLGCTIHGSSRWLHLGFITFQPSELLKYTSIVYLAYFFAKKANRIRSLWVYLPFLIILAAISIPLLLQPDFGMTVTICLTGIIMAFIAGVPIKYLTRTALGLLPLLGILIYLKPYRIKRILTFLNPWADPKGAGFQIIQSFIAISSGGFWGVGLSQSKQKFFYLPMQHTDFIFSIIAEEIGFFGILCIIFVFLMFLYVGLRLAFQQGEPFSRLAICGFVVLISLQALINMSVATGLVPTKGIGLPFISYGNSSIVSTLMMLGFITNISLKSDS